MTCLGHVSGTWHAGSVRFRDEASRQALTSLCTAALFSGLGPLGPSWNEDVEMETRGIVVREGAEGPRIAELEVAERACERLCSGLAREGAGWILGLKPETPLGHLYPRAAWGRGEDRWPLQTRGRGHSQHRERAAPTPALLPGGGPSLGSHGTPTPSHPSWLGATSGGRELRSWRHLCPPPWAQTLTFLPAACLAAERPLSMSFPLSSARFSSSAFSSVFHSINPSAFRKQRKVSSALTEVRRV